MTEESWEPVDYGRYEVSNLGRVRNLKTGVYLTPTDNGDGYPKVSLSADGLVSKVYVHQLVAESFVANTRLLKEINHIDGNRSNAAATNLEWVTSSENKCHARDDLGSVMGGAPKPVVLTNIATGTVSEFKSIAAAARELEINRVNLIMTLQSKRKSVNGYSAKYKG